MFVGCVVVWAAALEFGQFVDAAGAVVWAAAAVLANVFVLAAVTVWNDILADVVESPATAAASAAAVLTSLAYGAVTACFAMEPVCGSAVELVHVSVESAAMNVVNAAAEEVPVEHM